MLSRKYHFHLNFTPTHISPTPYLFNLNGDMFSLADKSWFLFLSNFEVVNHGGNILFSLSKLLFKIIILIFSSLFVSFERLIIVLELCILFSDWSKMLLKVLIGQFELLQLILKIQNSMIFLINLLLILPIALFKLLQSPLQIIDLILKLRAQLNNLLIFLSLKVLHCLLKFCELWGQNFTVLNVLILWILLLYEHLLKFLDCLLELIGIVFGLCAKIFNFSFLVFELSLKKGILLAQFHNLALLLWEEILFHDLLYSLFLIFASDSIHFHSFDHLIVLDQVMSMLERLLQWKNSILRGWSD